MTYELIKPWRLYPGQSTIPLPKTNLKSENRRSGFGNAVFLISPSREASINLIRSGIYAFHGALYRNLSADGYYRTKIGQKTIRLAEASATKKYYTEALKDSGVFFVSEGVRKSITKASKNLIVDLSRWCELWFQYASFRNPERIVKGFMGLLDEKLKDPSMPDYSKTLLIDLADWATPSNQLILMSPKLLNNPVSIILYAAYKFPDTLWPFKQHTLYITNRDTKQVLKVPMGELDAEHVKLLKFRLKSFQNIVISSEDEDEPVQQSSANVKAEMIAEERARLKEKIISSLKGSLTGKIVLDTDDEEAVNDSDESTAEETEDELDMMEEDAINAALAEALNGKDYSSDEDDDELEKKVAERAKAIYIAKFIPTRTPEQEARISRLTKGQKSVIRKQDPRDMKSKVIDKTDLSSYIETTNPTIKESKFMNFDKGYIEKKFDTDVDNAVAALSKASYPVFITSKEEIDSSDAMNLKKTLVYHMEDSKGNRSTIKFDIPIIIDNDYVFLNGSKKIITHQFMILPIAKTGPDTVQLVSWYQKIFLTRTGMIDENTNLIVTYLLKHSDEFNTVVGNNSMKNDKYDTPLDFDVIARNFSSFEIGNYKFMTSIDGCRDAFIAKYPNAALNSPPAQTGAFPVAIDTEKKELLYYYPSTGCYTDFLLGLFTDKQREELSKIKRKPRLFSMQAKILGKRIPAIIFMLHAEGFTKVMEKAGIEYKFVNAEEKENMDPLKWAFIQLEDCILAWSKSEQANTLLLNPLMKIPMEVYSREQLDSKDTYFEILTSYYPGNSDISGIMDNYYEFFIDPATEEILTDMKMPTNLVELMIVAARMLSDSKYRSENDLSNMRIRSAEVLPNIVYSTITQAYKKYRKTTGKNKPTQVAIKQSAIIDAFLDGKKTNLVADASALNPVLELEKSRAVTFRGLRGIQLDRAMTQARRGYDESMLGVLGITTTPDANVGVVREMTLEPAIENTRGMIKPGNRKDVQDKAAVNLFGAHELLTPLGVQHDDPDRTAIEIAAVAGYYPVNCWEV